MKENWQENGQLYRRFRHQWLRLCFYAVIVVLVFNVSWEQFKAANATMVVPAEIPDEALRLRILAHSDRPEDQWVKQKVRDQVTALIADWVMEAKSIEEARAILTQALPQLQKIVNRTLQDAGMTYGSHIQLGLIPFPTKLYGNRLYPAGDYEGLLITLGAGQGENWWCVLFPPLCFVDFGSGQVLEEGQEHQQADNDATSEDETNEDGTNVDETYEGETNTNQDETKTDEDETSGTEKGEKKQDETIEVRFFLLELLLKIKNFFTQ